MQFIKYSELRKPAALYGGAGHVRRRVEQAAVALNSRTLIGVIVLPPAWKFSTIVPPVRH